MGGSFSARMLKILKCCSSKPLETDEGEQTSYETFVLFCVTYFEKVGPLAKILMSLTLT